MGISTTQGQKGRVGSPSRPRGRGQFFDHSFTANGEVMGMESRGRARAYRPLRGESIRGPGNGFPGSAADSSPAFGQPKAPSLFFRSIFLLA
jgi:hypothetical protein